ncbi:phosphoglycerate mutase-like protein [Dinothrombium tinctorium]|uniref:Fructose-2,6-bisphosphatase TIGAR n=1 Tax=Dinothrombium tinctorium TaxID=1965070 RepID=A0A3S3PVD3_9ACAR|nr:phosphoglycerate mutase-like protein [Dinothrombium tinctorium]RWS07944.1 phosphoglycerate mutase-like protein [Dinothrombium tinctorium]RWS08798.1 phosphoglycerate mutase-like protein [Dinothrombium tinctorium]RWS08803.1 phosphoglycerate mutase-like protein [Dinothrombium tinctorium]
MSVSKFQLILVRHGETEENVSTVVQGQRNTKLSEYGLRQAKKLGEYFKQQNLNFELVFSSDLERAAVTCREIVGTAQEIIFDKRLRERSMGSSDNSTLAEYTEEAKNAGFEGENFYFYTPDGGETIAEVDERVKDFFINHLHQMVKQDFNVLIVTHAFIIVEFMKILSKEFNCSFPEKLRVSPNTGYSVFEIYFDEKSFTKAYCKKYLQTCHLDNFDKR